MTQSAKVLLQKARPWLPLLGHLLALGMTGGMAAWALTGRALGPHLEANFELTRAALSGRFEPSQVLQYGTAMVLRAFVELVGDRRLSATLQAVLASSTVVLCTYALALRAAGRVWGLLATALALSFVPLAVHYSTPLPSTQGAAFAALALVLSEMPRRTGLTGDVLDGATGFLGAAALACHPSLFAAQPVIVLALLAQTPHRGRTSLLALGGFLLGLLLLVAGHAALHGDALFFLRSRALDAMAGELSGYPWPTMWRKKSFHSPVLSPLLARGTRELVLAGALGLSLHLRRPGTAQRLALWLTLQVPLTLWLSSDGDPSELVRGALTVFTPALAVGGALLLDRVARSPGLPAEELPSWMVLLVAVCACAIAATGIDAEVHILIWHNDGFATKRSAMFLFTLAVPTCLGAAAMLRWKALRAVPWSLAVCALLLSGQRTIAEYYAEQRPIAQEWARFATGLARLSPPQLAVYYPGPLRAPLSAEELSNRLSTLSPRPLTGLRIRVVPQPDYAGPDELLLIDFGRRDRILRFRAIEPGDGYAHLTRVQRGSSIGQVFIPPALQPRIPAALRQFGH